MTSSPDCPVVLLLFRSEALHEYVCDHVVHVTRYDFHFSSFNLFACIDCGRPLFLFFCVVFASVSTMFAAASCCLCYSSSRSYVVTQPNRLLMRCAACANGLARSSSCCCGSRSGAASADSVRGAPASGAAWPMNWARIVALSLLLAL